MEQSKEKSELDEVEPIHVVDALVVDRPIPIHRLSLSNKTC